MKQFPEIGDQVTNTLTQESKKLEQEALLSGSAHGNSIRTVRGILA